jgi:hypothetical protein
MKSKSAAQIESSSNIPKNGLGKRSKAQVEIDGSQW